MKIRLWKLGSLEHKIMPTKKSIDRLREILSNANGEVVDMIWGPDINVELVEIDDKIDNYIVEDGKLVKVNIGV